MHGRPGRENPAHRARVLMQPERRNFREHNASLAGAQIDLWRSSVSASTQARARIAALSRSRSADDPELIDARRDLAAANIEAHITRIVAAAPPLSADQRNRLALLLGGANATPGRVLRRNSRATDRLIENEG